MRYPTDLSNREWESIKTFIPKPTKRGRPPKVDFREVLNACFYLLRTGCQRKRIVEKNY